MDRSFNWKLYVILVALSLLGLIAITPYSLALQGEAALSTAAAQTNMAPLLVLTVSLGSQWLLFAVAIWVGLTFAKPIGLGLPMLEDRLQGRPVTSKLRAIFPISVGLGILTGLLIVALEGFVFAPALAAEFGQNALDGASAVKPEAWKGFLASFYGGMNEEFLLRLCVMSFLAWLGRFISKRADGRPRLGVLWAANIVAAVLFGLGHLPATAQLVPLTPLVFVRAIVLNGLAGVAFGYLYFTRGLESAMVSHFSADIVLHVLFAL